MQALQELAEPRGGGHVVHACTIWARGPRVNRISTLPADRVDRSGGAPPFAFGPETARIGSAEQETRLRIAEDAVDAALVGGDDLERVARGAQALGRGAGDAALDLERRRGIAARLLVPAV